MSATASKFRKKPVEVEARQWTGENLDAIQDFTGSRFLDVDPEDQNDDPEITAQVFDVLHSTWVGVKTGQWVIRGVRGEFYPCDAAVFAETYEACNEVKGATVDREAVAGMTVREVCQKYAEAYDGGAQTAGEVAELDYVEDLMDALNEELGELRQERDRLNGLANRVPESQEQRPTATAMLAAWLDDQEAELAKLREFARQVELAWADMDPIDAATLTEIAEDLDLGWEARA